MPTIKPYALNWTTVANGTKKQAVTHFGVTYTLYKNLNGTWFANVTVPGFGGRRSQTETLVTGATFAQARKAAQDDATKSGGR